MTNQKNHQKYQIPHILSVRIGFSADHSHECYGCPICGKFGSGEIAVCEECGRSWSDDIDMGGMECYDYCEMKWSGDFCALHGDGWCQSHGRIVKFKDIDGILAKRGLCIDCFYEIYYRFHRYCTNCRANVIISDDNKCPFCATIVLEDTPNEWEQYKKTHNPLPHEPPLDYEW
ncbi:hypothetical protein LCGC14_1064970 [marine sediment metagenome]|uniref:Uncharacterized protein n=1 Tax=marine sediment metagenome TaxID=412755 RepID=A0A0F9MJW7_9ZZZZ